MCIKSKQEGEKFVQHVQAAPEPSCVLALEQHLLDLERFYTCKDEFTILGFDPTFNCGKFSVLTACIIYLECQNVIGVLPVSRCLTKIKHSNTSQISKHC